jgi:hypothetical protein
MTEHCAWYPLHNKVCSLSHAHFLSPADRLFHHVDLDMAELSMEYVAMKEKGLFSHCSGMSTANSVPLLRFTFTQTKVFVYSPACCFFRWSLIFPVSYRANMWLSGYTSVPNFQEHIFRLWVEHEGITVTYPVTTLKFSRFQKGGRCIRSLNRSQLQN